MWAFLNIQTISQKFIQFYNLLFSILPTKKELNVIMRNTLWCLTDLRTVKPGMGEGGGIRLKITMVPKNL